MKSKLKCNKVCWKRLECVEWKEIMKSETKQGQVFKEEDINQVKSCKEQNKQMRTQTFCLWRNGKKANGEEIKVLE